ncbi:hypothetical protein IQ22_03651 [Pseudomonas duriflava]|uniref:Lipoprotein n=1 Tax=Pseudomonas duriflava TaxID=459528 RepID=A0A562Q2S6_9PSED|nr:hypothetical protein [Pseudomonas duriflava]TWI50952.1 hypothetical protein IQ22_03651 [Pseudomonas duriflava]
MNKWIPLLATSALLMGCAAHTPSLTEDEQRLLLQNDLLQAKILVVAGGEDDLRLANALLTRAARQASPQEKNIGEIEFYKALILMKQGPQTEDVLTLLDRSANKQYPLAYALLYQIYSKPYLVDEADPIRAETYKDKYGELDVAKSGYPSFEKALILVDRLSGTTGNSEASEADMSSTSMSQ